MVFCLQQFFEGHRRLSKFLVTNCDTIETRGVEKIIGIFLLFASLIFADTSRSVFSTALEPSMPSRDEEILWCLKRLFTSHFWPKIASFKLSETKLLVFAIKKGIFFFSYEHILRQPKEAY